MKHVSDLIFHLKDDFLFGLNLSMKSPLKKIVWVITPLHKLVDNYILWVFTKNKIVIKLY